MKNREEGVRKQIILNISDANQATSVIRAIMLSSDPKHQLFLHLYSTEYQSIVINIHKLFDKQKSSTNLIRLVKLYKNEIKSSDYENALLRFGDIQKKYSNVLSKIEILRNNLGAHLNREELNKMYENFLPDNDPDLTEIQGLLKEVITVIKELNFMDKKDLVFLDNRLGPKDVMDIFHLEIHKDVFKSMLSGGS